jgi:hypothetical protein
MRRHSLQWMPAMEQKTSRFQHKICGPIRLQIQRDLM